MTFSKVKLDLGNYTPYLASPNQGFWKYEKQLPLTTDGQLRVMALGVGAAFANTMFQSNFIVCKGKTTVFVDFGTKSATKLQEFGRSVLDVENLIVTHSHADHIGGLEEIALKGRYMKPFILKKQKGECKPKLWVSNTYSRELYHESLKGGLAYSEEDARGYMQIEDYFDVMSKHIEYGNIDIGTEKIESFEFNIGEGADSIKFTLFAVPHIPDSATRVNDSMFCAGMLIDGRCYISGDTKFNRSLTIIMSDFAEASFHDCQDFPGGVHANYEELKTLPEENKKNMFLYHLTDGMLKKEPEKDGFAGFMEPAPTAYDFY